MGWLGGAAQRVLLGLLWEGLLREIGGRLRVGFAALATEEGAVVTLRSPPNQADA